MMVCDFSLVLILSLLLDFSLIYTLLLLVRATRACVVAFLVIAGCSGILLVSFLFRLLSLLSTFLSRKIFAIGTDKSTTFSFVRATISFRLTVRVALLLLLMLGTIEIPVFLLRIIEKENALMS